jgi:hypothetical protein
MPLPLAVPIGMALLGGILGHKSKNKQQDQANAMATAEHQRAQQAEDARARARANMMAGMLKGYGRGGGIDAESLYQMFRKNIAMGPQAITAGRNMGAIGGGLSGIAMMLLKGMSGGEEGEGGGTRPGSMDWEMGLGAGAGAANVPQSNLYGNA